MYVPCGIDLCCHPAGINQRRLFHVAVSNGYRFLGSAGVEPSGDLGLGPGRLKPEHQRVPVWSL